MGKQRGGQIDPIRAVAARAVHDPHGGEVFKALLAPLPGRESRFSAFKSSYCHQKFDFVMFLTDMLITFRKLY